MHVLHVLVMMAVILHTVVGVKVSIGMTKATCFTRWCDALSGSM